MKPEKEAGQIIELLNKIVDKIRYAGGEAYMPEKEAGEQIELEHMAKALDKLCIDNLCDMQQTFEKQVEIMHKLLYEELLNVMNHTMAVMKLCSGYSSLVKDLLKSNGQIDIKLVYSHFTKIGEIFGEISNSFDEGETGETANSIKEKETL